MSSALRLSVPPSFLSSVSPAGTPVLRESMSLTMTFFPLISLWFPVGGNHALVSAPGCFNLNVPIVSEEVFNAFLLLLGQQSLPGVQSTAGLVVRVAGTAAVPARGLLNPAPAVIQRVPGQADNVERIHDRDSCTQFLGGSTFEAGEAIHSHDLHPVPPRFRAFLQPGGEDLLGTAFDHARRRDGPVLSRAGVRSMIMVTYLSPRRVCRYTCSSTPMILTPLKRSGSS